MYIFELKDFEKDLYCGTLFSEIMVVDHRNKKNIMDQPITPEERILVFRKSAEYSIYPKMKLDGSPDFRFNPVSIGGGDQWLNLETLIHHLNRVELSGDIFENPERSGFPAAIQKWPRGKTCRDAAILVSLKGWMKPLYFEGDFQLFSDALESLSKLLVDIKSGTAQRIETIIE